MKRIDLTGQRYGKLVVEKMLYNYEGKNRTKCLCKCDCGKKNVIRDAYLIRKAKDSSCGCGKKECVRKSHGRDVDGQKFGRLTVIRSLWNETPVKVECLCECGKTLVCTKRDVLSGHTKSCGCLNRDKISERNKVDYSGMESEYGVKILHPSKLNKYKQWIWVCKCGFCGKEFEELPARILNNHVRSCGCINKSSREKLIENYLKELSVDYIPQYKLDGCRSKSMYPLRFDFAIFIDNNLHCLIEYDGEQHFHPVEIFGGLDGYKNTLERDKIKNDYCKENNIMLVRLPYTMQEQQIRDVITNIIYP